MIVEWLEGEGWIVQYRRSGHYCGVSPDGQEKVFFSSTPSDPRAVKNIEAKIKRARRRYAERQSDRRRRRAQSMRRESKR